MRMRIIIHFIVVVLLIGCSSKVNFDEVVGFYKLRYPYGTEELRLNKDGTYIQSVLIDGETNAITKAGKWKFDEEELDIILIDAMVVDDFFGHPKKDYRKTQPGLSAFAVKKSFWKIYLLVNPDQGFIFEKIN